MSGVVEQPQPTILQLLAKAVDRALHLALRGVLEQVHVKAKVPQRPGHRARVIDRVAQWGALVGRVADDQGHLAGRLRGRLLDPSNPLGRLS